MDPSGHEIQSVRIGDIIFNIDPDYIGNGSIDEVQNLIDQANNGKISALDFYHMMNYLEVHVGISRVLNANNSEEARFAELQMENIQSIYIDYANGDTSEDNLLYEWKLNGVDIEEIYYSNLYYANIILNEDDKIFPDAKRVDLSPQAKLYIEYYKDYWEEAKQEYYRSIVEFDAAKAFLSKINMEYWGDKIRDIRKLDSEGKISGYSYSVRVYKQGHSNLCWAFCQVMVEDYYNNEKKPVKEIIHMTQEEATERAIEIAKSVCTDDNKDDWDKKGCPTNAGGFISVQLDDYSIIEVFLRLGPVYASYSNEYLYEDKEDPDIKGHLVVITGMASAEGHDTLIKSNNPWGAKNLQTLEEFFKYIPEDPFCMVLESVSCSI